MLYQDASQEQKENIKTYFNKSYTQLIDAIKRGVVLEDPENLTDNFFLTSFSSSIQKKLQIEVPTEVLSQFLEELKIRITQAETLEQIQIQSQDQPSNSGASSEKVIGNLTESIFPTDDASEETVDSINPDTMKNVVSYLRKNQVDYSSVDTIRTHAFNYFQGKATENVIDSIVRRFKKLERQKTYMASKKGKEKKKAYEASDSGKTSKKAYRTSKKGKQKRKAWAWQQKQKKQLEKDIASTSTIEQPSTNPVDNSTQPLMGLTQPAIKRSRSSLESSNSSNKSSTSQDNKRTFKKTLDSSKIKRSKKM